MVVVSTVISGYTINGFLNALSETADNIAKWAAAATASTPEQEAEAVLQIGAVRIRFAFDHWTAGLVHDRRVALLFIIVGEHKSIAPSRFGRAPEAWPTIVDRRRLAGRVRVLAAHAVLVVLAGLR